MIPEFTDLFSFHPLTSIDKASSRARTKAAKGNSRSKTSADDFWSNFFVNSSIFRKPKLIDTKNVLLYLYPLSVLCFFRGCSAFM